MPTAMQMLAARYGIPPQTPMDPELAQAQQEGPIIGSAAPAEQPPISPEPSVSEGPSMQDTQPPAQNAMEVLARQLQARDAAKRAELEKYLKQSRTGLSGLEEAQKLQMQQPAQLDLSPLAALSDSLSPGGKLLSGYQKPQTAQANAQQNLTNLEAIQQRREALTKLAEGADHSNGDYMKILLAQNKDQLGKDRLSSKETLNAQSQLGRVEKDLFARADGFSRMKDLLANATDKSIPVQDRVAANEAFRSMLTQEQLRLETGARTASSVAEQRETKYASEKIKNMLQSIGNAPLDTLPDAEVKNIGNTFNVMGKSYLEQGNRAYNQLKSRATPTQRPVFDKSHEEFLRQYEPILKGAATGPKVGEVQDGHRFKGGNPADQNNWEVVK